MAQQRISVLARFKAKPGEAEAVRSWLASMVEPVRGQPGNMGAEVHRAIDDDSAFVLYETWRSQADFEAHRQQAFDRGIDRDLAQRLDGPYSLTVLAQISRDTPPPPPHQAAAEGAPAAGDKSLLGNAVLDLDRRFTEAEGAGRPPGGAAEAPVPEAPGPEVSAAKFRHLVGEAEHEAELRRQEHQREAAEQRDKEVRRLGRRHLSEAGWRGMLDGARRAAERGETEFMLLRFPNQLCSDGGRAVNAPEPDWPATLRGEAADVYHRWERELKSKGFRLSARVVDFPDGIPGDIGLFLGWGG